MPARFGNTSASGLIRAAESARNRVAAYEEQAFAFEWENSAKTKADFKEYSKFLNKRLSTIGDSDPNKALTIKGKLRTAQRAHFSEEIQRETIAIQLGGSTEEAKLNKLAGLFRRAVKLGDNNLAQNLLQQYNTQAIKLENAAIAESNRARTAGGRAATTYKKQVRNLSKAILSGDGFNDDGTPQLGYIKNKIATDGLRATMSYVEKNTGYTLAQLIQASVYQAAQLRAEAGTDTDIEQAQKMLSGETTFEIAPGFRVSYADLQQEAELNAQGQSSFGEVVNVQGEKTIRRQALSGTAVSRTADGKVILNELYDPTTQFDTNAIAEKLRTRGYDVSINERGTLEIIDPRTGQQITALPTSDGELLFSRGYDEQGNELIGRIDVETGEFSDLNADQVEMQINPSFAGNLGTEAELKPTSVTRSIGTLPGAAGLTETIQGPQGVGQLLQAAETGKLLQQAADVQKQLKDSGKFLQKTATAADLNSLRLPKAQKLKVAAPPKLPTVKVAKPKPLPKVKVAPPKKDNRKVVVTGAPASKPPQQNWVQRNIVNPVRNFFGF